MPGPYSAFPHARSRGHPFSHAACAARCSVDGGNYNDTSMCQSYQLAPCAHHTASSKYPQCDGSTRIGACERSCIDNKADWAASKHSGKGGYSVCAQGPSAPPCADAMAQEIYNNGPITGMFFVHQSFTSYKSGVCTRRPLRTLLCKGALASHSYSLLILLTPYSYSYSLLTFASHSPTRALQTRQPSTATPCWAAMPSKSSDSASRRASTTGSSPIRGTRYAMAHAAAAVAVNALGAVALTATALAATAFGVAIDAAFAVAIAAVAETRALTITHLSRPHAAGDAPFDDRSLCVDVAGVGLGRLLQDQARHERVPDRGSCDQRRACRGHPHHVDGRRSHVNWGMLFCSR